MATFEKDIEAAIAAKEIAGCVLVSSNRDGSFQYTKSFGNTSMDPARAKPITPDTIMWVASCTKLMTSISAMQLVEKGLVTLDEPVYKHIPELESLEVITRFEESGKPILEKHKTPITLRALLTHTSGLTYDAIHPKTIAWAAYNKLRIPNASGKLLERYSVPLVFEAGEGWTYGSGIDYAGLLVERVTRKTLEEYMKENLWSPLGIKDMTFNLGRRPDLEKRMADMTLRGEDGKLSLWTARLPYKDQDGNDVTECYGGQGSFLSAGEYLKILHGLLSTEENEKILKKESVDLFFTPQLNEAGSKALNAALQDDFTNNAMGGTPKDIKKDWGLGGILLTSDALDGKKAGTMLWGGLPNLIWWVDRKTGLCGLYASQLLPTGDSTSAALMRNFEAGMYQKYAQSQSVSSPRL